MWRRPVGQVDRDADQQRASGQEVRRPVLPEGLAGVAASIACTEGQVAETLERMALALPEDAMRLQANAERARHFATLERNWATLLRLPR
jgi:hypothetical protein